MNKITHLLVSILCISMTCTAQLKYSLNFSAGQTNLIKTELVSFGHNTDPLNPINNFEIGFNVLKQLPMDHLSIETGITYKNLGSEVYGGESNFNYFKYCNLNIPLNINYNLYQWFAIYGGIVYSYNIRSKETKSFIEVKHNTYGWDLGADFYIAKRIRIGGYYYKSIRNSLIIHSITNAYKPKNYGIKLGYIFN